MLELLLALTLQLQTDRAALCNATQPSVLSFPRWGGARDVTPILIDLTTKLEVPGDCKWFAASPVNWVMVSTDPPSGERGQLVTLLVAENTGGARWTRVTIGWAKVDIYQRKGK